MSVIRGALSALVVARLLRRQCLRSSAHVGAVKINRRGFCIAADEDKYLELKQLKDIKSEAFYDEQNLHRRYFYYIDLQGRLFLENTRPKNIATSLKSAKFLRFFFSQIRPNQLRDAGRPSAEEVRDIVPFLEYPYRSPCGKEMNFIKCADRPMVLEDLRPQEGSGTEWEFVLGGGEMTMPFRPDALKISLTTGRLYHDIETRHFPSGYPESLGLVRSQVAVELGRSIQLYDDPEGDVVGEFEWQNQVFPVRSIA